MNDVIICVTKKRNNFEKQKKRKQNQEKNEIQNWIDVMYVFESEGRKNK